MCQVHTGIYIRRTTRTMKKPTAPLATQKRLPRTYYTWYLSLRIRTSDSSQLEKRKGKERQKRKRKRKRKNKIQKTRQDKKRKQGKERKKTEKNTIQRTCELANKDGMGLIEVSSASMALGGERNKAKKSGRPYANL